MDFEVPQEMPVGAAKQLMTSGVQKFMRIYGVPIGEEYSAESFHLVKKRRAPDPVLR